jgi:hypothetical protein
MRHGRKLNRGFKKVLGRPTTPVLKELERYKDWPICEIDFSYDCGHRQRVCNNCKGPIMKGEPHFSKYVRDGRFNTRYNTCAFCAMASMNSAMKRMMNIMDLLEEYIKSNPAMASRNDFFKTFKELGKGESPWETL